jgi:hypothetical protein
MRSRSIRQLATGTADSKMLIDAQDDHSPKVSNYEHL